MDRPIGYRGMDADVRTDCAGEKVTACFSSEMRDGIRYSNVKRNEG